MKRIRTQKPRTRRGRSWLEVLLANPRDPDVVRAKALAHARRADSMPAAQPKPGTALQAYQDRPAVWATGLAKSYGATVALAGLDLHVSAGETVALLGPNGAGKTTTISLLLGLLSPGRGQVQVHGRPPSQAVAAGWSAPCSKTPP